MKSAPASLMPHERSLSPTQPSLSSRNVWPSALIQPVGRTDCTMRLMCSFTRPRLTWNCAGSSSTGGL